MLCGGGREGRGGREKCACGVGEWRVGREKCSRGVGEGREGRGGEGREGGRSVHVHRQPTQVVNLRAQAINVLIINPFEQELQQVEKREEYKVLPPHSTRDQVLPTVQHIPGVAAVRAGPRCSTGIGVATFGAG